MKFFGIIFSVIGLILLAFSGILFVYEHEFIAQSETGTGKVINLRREVDSKGKVTYYPVVAYTSATGKKYIFDSSYGSNPASYELGEPVEVYYLPGQPYNAEIKGFFAQWLAVMVTGFLGILFCGSGIKNFLEAFKHRQSSLWLQAHGQKIITSLQSVEQNTSVRVNGKHPYVVYTQWLNPQTSQLHTFTSENLWYDPSDLISGQIEVTVDTKNYNKYRMHIPAQPELHYA